MRYKKNKNNSSQLTKFIVPGIAIIVALLGIYLLIQKGKNGKGEEIIEATNAVVPEEALGDSLIKATIYLDVSASMAGYANGGPNNYIDVLSDLYSIYPGTNAKLVGNGGVIPGDSLVDLLVWHKITYGKESLLHNDLKVLADDAQRSLQCDSTGKVSAPVHLNFLVTDAIMSFSSEEIKKEPEINTIKAQALQNQITAAFAGKADVGVSLFQFRSRFTGDYYCYNNNKVPLKGADRYFYIVAIGPRGALANFKQKMEEKKQDAKNFKFVPNAQWHAIDRLPLNSGLSIGPVGNVKEGRHPGEYLYNPVALNKANAGEGNIDFRIDLGKLLVNHSLTDLKALENRVKVSIDGLEQKSLTPQIDETNGLLTFNLTTGQLGSESKVSVTIPTEEPLWVERSSIDNDLSIQKIPTAATFQFEKFVRGIENGIHPNGAKVLFQQEVKLIQEK